MTTDEALEKLWERYPREVATLDIVPPGKGGPRFSVALDAADGSIPQGRGPTLADAIQRLLDEH